MKRIRCDLEQKRMKNDENIEFLDRLEHRADPIQGRMRPGTEWFQRDILIVIYTFWENRLEFFSVLRLVSLLTTRKTQPLGLTTEIYQKRGKKIEELKGSKLEEGNFSLFSPTFLPYTFSLMFIFFLDYPIVYCLMEG
jgi:hypothetical protein